MNNQDLLEKIDALYDLYEDIKSEVRDKDSDLYDQWKAGGFLVDTDILSMYPNLSGVSEKIEEIAIITTKIVDRG